MKHTIVTDPKGPAPWTPERRAQVMRKISKEADRAAARIGADAVMIVAFFRHGEYLHLQDGGKTPVPPKELYERLASAHTMTAGGNGEDIEIQ